MSCGAFLKLLKTLREYSWGKHSHLLFDATLSCTLCSLLNFFKQNVNLYNLFSILFIKSKSTVFHCTQCTSVHPVPVISVCVCLACVHPKPIGLWGLWPHMLPRPLQTSPLSPTPCPHYLSARGDPASRHRTPGLSWEKLASYLAVAHFGWGIFF